MKRFFPGVLLAVLLGTAGPCLGASNPGGSNADAADAAAVAGVVRDAQGTPQMGALVELLTADATVAASAFTDEHGRYLIATVLPGQYRLRASAAFLVPATRANLRLQAGAEAIVNLTMSTLFEMESWLPAQKRRASEPADDWKWTLRSTANRPLLRLVGGNDGSVLSSSSEAAESRRPVSQERVAVTSGDGDFGEGGVHQVLVVNRTIEDGDSAIFRAEIGDPEAPITVGPSVETTVGYEQRSMAGSTRLVSSYQEHPELTYGGGSGVQVLRLASTHEMNIGDAVRIDAGTLIQAERLEATLMTAEPFVRVSVQPSSGVTVEYRYAAGRTLQSSEDLDSVKPALDVLTNSAGRPLSDKGSHNEISISRKLGERTITFTAYHDSVANTALVGSGLVDNAGLQTVAMITDPTTGTFRLATEGYTGRGVSASVVQPLTPVLAAWAEYDLGTALRSDFGVTPAIGAVQEGIAARTAQALSVALRGRIVRSGTSLKAEYRWQPARTLTQVNAYDAGTDEAYLSFYVRQRIWCGRFLPSGIDAVVEATNLLEQGYEPVLGPDGSTLYLAQVARAVQGGLAFNF